MHTALVFTGAFYRFKPLHASHHIEAGLRAGSFILVVILNGHYSLDVTAGLPFQEGFFL